MLPCQLFDLLQSHELYNVDIVEVGIEDELLLLSLGVQRGSETGE